MLATVFTFFTSTAIGRFFGKLIIGAAIVGGAYLAGDIHGRTVADKSAEIAALKAQIAAKDADARIAQELQAAAEKKLAELQARADDADRQVTDYAEAVSKLTDQSRSCRGATDDDVKRLRNIK